MQSTNFDVLTYDRMNVLLTEIRRLITEGAKVKLYSQGREPLDEEDLAYLMFPGVFYSLEEDE